MLGAGKPKIGDSLPVRVKRSFHFQKRPSWFCGPPGLLFLGYWPFMFSEKAGGAWS